MAGIYKLKDHIKGDTLSPVTFTIKAEEVPINLTLRNVSIFVKTTHAIDSSTSVDIELNRGKLTIDELTHFIEVYDNNIEETTNSFKLNGIDLIINNLSDVELVKRSFLSALSNIGDLIICNCNIISNTDVNLRLDGSSLGAGQLFDNKQFYNNRVSDNVTILDLDDFDTDRKSGTTTQRPDITWDFIEVGFNYFDTDLGYEITSNGVNWVDYKGDII